MDPNIEMSDINKIVDDAFEAIGVEPTIDLRVDVLAGLAKNVADMDIDPLLKTRVCLMMTVEIVRLRTEKQIFGL